MLASICSKLRISGRSTIARASNKPFKRVSLAYRWKSGHNGPDPNKIYFGPIPRDKLQFSFSASSGPGGQNVNRVNTKVELRFKPEEAHWIPIEMRQRFIDMNRSRINKEGDMIISSQRERKQDLNLEDCVAKLKQYLEEASWIPKERIATEVPEYENVKRIEVRLNIISTLLDTF